MSSNPDLTFALANRSSPPPLPPKTRKFKLPDPCHGCVAGLQLRTCKVCAGRPSRQAKATSCSHCNGKGFVGSKCSICAEAGKLATTQLAQFAWDHDEQEREKEQEVAGVQNEEEEVVVDPLSSSDPPSSSPSRG